MVNFIKVITIDNKEIILISDESKIPNVIHIEVIALTTDIKRLSI